MAEKKMLKRSNNVVTREIEGKVILMPLHSSSKDLNYIYTLNETAALAWSLMDGKTPLADIKGRLLARYETVEARIDKELAVLIKDLRSIKALN